MSFTDDVNIYHLAKMLPIRFLHGQVTVVPFLNIIYPGGDIFKTVQISCFFWNFYPRMDRSINLHYYDSIMAV